MLSALLLSSEYKEPNRRTYTIGGTLIGFVYGLLFVGNGAAMALIPAGLAAIIGFAISKTTERPLRLPFAIGGAVVGLVIAGVWNPIPVVFFTGLGCALGYFVPVIFSTFNTYYARFERFYAWLLGWVLSHRRVIWVHSEPASCSLGLLFQPFQLALFQRKIRALVSVL